MDFGQDAGGRRPARRWRACLARCVAAMAVGLGIALPATAADTVARTPVPDWVDLRPVPSGKGTAVATDGLRYLQLDDQLLLGGPRPQWFRTVAFDVVRGRALAEAGQFSIGFQPAFQSVALHAIDVVRDGAVLDRLAASRVEVIRRESDLETRMLDGRLTAHVTIPDLRVGDRVVYRYTVTGENPVFGTGHFDTHALRFSTVLAERRVRYVAPAGLPLHWRVDKAGYARGERVEGGRRIVEYVATALPKVVEEGGTPGGFDPYGTLEASTSADWAAVGRWAAPLYAFDATDPALVATARQLRLDDADREAALLRAVAFVQGEVRYTAIDLGTRAYAPNAPALVLDRRFGDCKDKSMLLVALLGQAGIAAVPVMVNTVAGDRVRGLLPRPTAFDHVVVRAELDGRAVWIDATRDAETGPLGQRDPLPFGAGLAAGGDALVAIPAALPPLPQVEVHQRIRLSPAAALLGVVTDYRGGEADRRRATYEDEDPAEIGEGYVGYMEEFHPGIEGRGAPVGEPAGDAFRTRESYRVPRDPDTGGAFDLVLFQLSDWLPTLDAGPRRQPLAFGGVRSGRQVLRADVPGGWTIAPEREVVENRYFRFVRDARVVGADLVLTGEWTRKADEIAPGDYAAVRDDLARARELLWFTVNTDTSGWELWASEPRDLWRPGLALLLFVVAMAAAWPLRRRFVSAAVPYRPREAMARSLADGPRWGVPMAWVLALTVFDAIYDDGASKRLGVDVAAAAFGIDALSSLLRSAIGALLLAGSLRIAGARATLAGQWLSLCWAAVPTVVAMACVTLALGGDVALLAEDAPMLPGALAPVMAAGLLALAGGLWSLVAWINLSSVSAGCSRRRIMVVLLAWLLLIGVIAAVGFAARTAA